MAEGQLTNEKAGVTRTPYNTNLAMSVHSLLLVDALQTLGPDHELLVASNKDVTLSSLYASSGYFPRSNISSSSTLRHTNPMPLLPTVKGKALLNIS